MCLIAPGLPRLLLAAVDEEIVIVERQPRVDDLDVPVVDAARVRGSAEHGSPAARRAPRAGGRGWTSPELWFGEN